MGTLVKVSLHGLEGLGLRAWGNVRASWKRGSRDIVYSVLGF